MVWTLIGAGFVLFGAVGAFLFGPTIKTFLGPDFEPAPKDPESVENAVTTRMVNGGQ